MKMPRLEPIDTMREHIRRLAQALGSEKFHVARMIVEENFMDPIVDGYEKAFDELDRKIESGEQISLEQIEIALKPVLPDADKKLRRIIAAYYEDDRFIFLARRLKELFGHPTEMRFIE